MGTREWLVTGFVAAFVALKLAEALLPLEAWPLTNVPMFSVRQPPEARPVRRSIEARRGDGWFVMHPWQLGLNRAELGRRLLRYPDPGRGCGELLRAFNARRPARLRVDEAYVRATTVARPGTGREDVEQRFPCPLGEAPR